MNNVKMCTDLQQSKKLLELGFNPRTADMFIQKYGSKTEYHVENHNWADAVSKYDENQTYVPAWSLAMLMSMFQSGTMFINRLKKYNASCYTTVKNTDYEYDELGRSDELLDSVFKMVLWLHENNLIDRKFLLTTKK